MRGSVAKPVDLQANQALDAKNNTLSANRGMVYPTKPCKQV